MLESFFILSLGITFVLVLFLVYHFKQRLTILENKCDTTFEIINNVVSELGNIRGAFRVVGAPAQTQTRPEVTTHSKINVIISDDDHDVSDYDDDDDEDSSDGDDDDEDDGDDEADGDDEDESSDEDNEIDGGGHGAHHVVHDVEESGEDEDSDGGGDGVHNIEESGEDHVNVASGSNDDSNTIRIINLDSQQEFDIIETVEDLTAENGNRDDQVDDENSHIENMEEILLHVEKLPTSEPHLDDSSIASSVAESKNNSHIYKKMTLPVLKAYVIEKGLASDPSKMKKQDLIHLIETSDI